MVIVIYGKPSCPNCVKTELMCDMNELPYTTKLLDEDYTQEDLEVLCGGSVRELPQIFVDGNHVGGYDEFRKLLYS